MARLKQRKVTVVFREGRGWVVEYRDQNGKRPRPTFKTQIEAENFAKTLRQGVVIEGETIAAFDGAKVPIKDGIRRYMDHGNQLTPRGLKTAKSHFESLWVFLRNEARIEFLHEIRLEHLDAFKARELKRITANSVRRMFATYSAWFNKLVAWGLIAKSPMQGFEKPKETEADIKTWTPEQVRQIAANLPEWAKSAVLVLERTGCRPVDLERLKWSDVDLRAGTISVLTLKGGQSRRDSIPLSSDVLKFLADRKHSRKPRASDLVFQTPRKNPVTADSLQDCVRRVAEDLGFEGVTIYGLRHTFAETLVDLGVHARDIQLLMRHRKFETTTRYTKRNSDHLKRIVEVRAKVVTEKQLGHNVVTTDDDGETTATAKSLSNHGVEIGAGDRARTDDLYLGKALGKTA